MIREGDSGDDFFWNADRGEFSATRWLDEKLFGNQIKTTPRDERPRERLLAQGAEQLRTSELLAILIRSGRPGESAVMAGQKIARQFQNRMQDLPSAGRGELKSISATSPSGFATPCPGTSGATWWGRARKSTRPGTSGVVDLSPFEFLDRLAALIPPPRKHRHRYHGVFAPNHPSGEIRKALKADLVLIII